MCAAFSATITVGALVLPLMMLSQVVLKTLYEVVVLPVTMRVVKWVKRCESEDVYDEGISYNIFAVFKNT